MTTSSGLFGTEIAELVDGVTKLTQLELTSTETAQAENFRKLLLAMARDVRVILVKLADRLHNMRTISNLGPEKRERIARETMEIYAPLAGRMGMQTIREQLEDLCFEVLNPEARTSILRRFLKLKRDTGDLIPEISAQIRGFTDEAGLDVRIEGREKRPYSVWRKMEEKQTGFCQLSDIYGFRIICLSRRRLLPGARRRAPALARRAGAVQGLYLQPQGERLSLAAHHGLFVVGDAHRDPDPHRGDARRRRERRRRALGLQGRRCGSRTSTPSTRIMWLRDLVARLEKGDEPQEFLEHVKLDLFHDQVFCFTPKGDVVGLPRGATTIDFAYAIHTKVGNHCAGAMVDGRRVPLWTRLRNGQQVEIVTARGQSPSPHWEDIAQTGRAKAAIRRALRSRLRTEQVALGRDLATQGFARAGREAGEKTFAVAAERLTYAAVEDMLADLARGRITSAQIIAAVYPSPAAARPDPVEEPTNGMRIRGIKRGRAVRFCDCCWPIPGDRIIGLGRKGGIVVHAIFCPMLEEFEDALERWHDLAWAEEADKNANNLARIELTLANQPGALGVVCTLVGEQRANIDNLSITTRKPDFFQMSIDLEVRDTKHLGDILSALRAQSFVNQVDRATGRVGAAEPPIEPGQPRLPLGHAAMLTH